MCGVQSRRTDLRGDVQAAAAAREGGTLGTPVGLFPNAGLPTPGVPPVRIPPAAHVYVCIVYMNVACQ